MISRIDRYVAQQVLGAMFIVATGVVGLDLVFRIIDQLPDLTESYTFIDLVIVVLLTFPQRLYENMPLWVLIGCLVGLGGLASSSELTVMRAAGMSPGRIAAAVIKPVAGLIVVMVLVGEYVVPSTQQMSIAHRAEALQYNTGALSRGVWHREGDTFIHIDVVYPSGRLGGLTRYEFEGHTLQRVSEAKYALFNDNEWVLSQVVATQIGETQTSVERHDEEVWKVEMTPGLLKTLAAKPENLSIQGLYFYSQYLASQGIAASDYEVAFWTKVLQPVAMIGLVIVGVSFIFGPLRGVTLGQRLMTGVGVGLVFSLLQDLTAPVTSVFGIPPLVAVMTPILLTLLFGAWLMRRAD